MTEHQDSLPPNVRKIVRPEPIIRADQMAHVMFRRRDPDEMERFLLDFGLIANGRDGSTRYYRGHGRAPFLVSIEAGAEDGFIGFGVSVRDRDELVRLAAAEGLPIETASTPGGGERVRLVDPWGMIVDVTFGATALAPLEPPTSTAPVNTPTDKLRVDRTVRPPLIPTPVFKLGHVVLSRPDFDKAADWYGRHLGLIASDVQYLADGSPALAFMRLDRGAEPADHHSVALLCSPKVEMMHVSFETFGMDSVGQGHQYLKAHGWTPYWGVGRHALGSQFFDYWLDSAGDQWEHYADGDVMTASYPTGYVALHRGTLWTWGDDLPDSMRPDLPLDAIPAIHAQGGFGDMPLDRVQNLMQAMAIPPRRWMR